MPHARWSEPASPAAGSVSRASALQLIDQLVRLTGVSRKHHEEQLRIGLWKWTEAEGMAPHARYNTRYLSAGVRNATKPARVNHEHVWTRKDLTAQLLAKTWALEELQQFLTAYGAACIVTVEEHGRLGVSKKAGWLRYADQGIGVWDRQGGEWVEPAKLMPGGGLVGRPVGWPVEVEPDPGDAATPGDAREAGAPGDAREAGAPGDAREAGALGEAGEAAIAGPAPVTPPPVAELVARNCSADLAGTLISFAKIVGWQQAVAVASVKRSVEVSKYFRVHDVLVEEPTRAVAYVHWSGKVDYGLQATELPGELLEHPLVNVLADKSYGITTTLAGPGSLDLAGDLLALALEKVRNDV